MRYWRVSEEVPKVIVHFRRKDKIQRVDLLEYYRQSLKASTVLKFRKQGVGILFTSFNHDQLNNLLANLKASCFNDFYGTDNE